jgi:NAD(P)-dependent dehydrogenase (short-subunit alcohol dehydrogenase family)
MNDNDAVAAAAQLLSRAGEQIHTATRAVNQALQLVGAIPVVQPVEVGISGGFLGAMAGETDLEVLSALAAVARKQIKDRRSRDSILGLPDLFGEPAWEILLDLFVANADSSRVSVSSACAGSTAPHTTALRYLKALEERAMIERTPHESDARIVYVTLSETGLSSMIKILSRA